MGEGGLSDGRSLWNYSRMSELIDTKQLKTMSVADRLRLLEEVWVTLENEPEGSASPEWHRAELDRRLAAHAAEPSNV